MLGRLLNAISEAESPIALAATGPPTILRAVAALETVREHGGPPVWLRGQCISVGAWKRECMENGTKLRIQTMLHVDFFLDEMCNFSLVIE